MEIDCGGWGRVTLELRVEERHPMITKAVSWVLREKLLCGKRSGHIRTR